MTNGSGRPEVVSTLMPRRIETGKSAKELAGPVARIGQDHASPIEPAGECDTARGAETSAASAEGRYAELYEFAPSAYLTLADQGVITKVNRAALALLGVEREAALGRPFGQFVVGEEIARWRDNLVGLGDPASRLSFEFTLLRGDGSRSCAQFEALRLACEGMAPVILVVLTDLAQRKQAEAALREQEEFFRLLAENLGDFVAVLDLDGRRIYNSPSYQRLFGPARDLRGTDSFAEIHADDRPRIKGEFCDTVVTGIGRQSEYRFVLADGSIRYMESVGAAIRDSAGRVVRVVVAARDVTERKQAEAQMRIAALAFEAREGMLVTDVSGVIQSVNPAFSELTGYSAAESIGRNPSMLASGRHDEAFYAAMWQTLRRDGSWRGEIWNRRKSGEVYPQWLTITAVCGDHGLAVTHYVATMSDISERKKAEDEFRHLALYDDLTQLPNRRLLLDRMQKAMAACGRSGRRGAVLLIDLDKFKELNDTHGHGHGDRLLKQVAALLNSCIRDADTAARLGGDEFVVMLTDLSADPEEATKQTTVVGEKILAALNRQYELAGKRHRITPSIGLTLFADQSATIDELLERADIAMYQAKAAGGNTMRFFGSAQD